MPDMTQMFGGGLKGKLAPCRETVYETLANKMKKAKKKTQIKKGKQK